MTTNRDYDGAAEAIGSEYKGRKAGGLGDIGTFSFHGTKALTTGEGAMLVTNREDAYQRALFLGNHGQQVGDKMYFNTRSVIRSALTPSTFRPA